MYLTNPTLNHRHLHRKRIISPAFHQTISLRSLMRASQDSAIPSPIEFSWKLLCKAEYSHYVSMRTLPDQLPDWLSFGHPKRMEVFQCDVAL